MSDKNLVTNPNAVKPIEDTANTENAIEERYHYDLYKNLEKELRKAIDDFSCRLMIF